MNRVYICKQCGAIDPRFTCSKSKEVHYYCKEHQSQNWKSHKRICKFVHLSQASVWIELPTTGDSLDFQEHIIDHLFSNKQAGLKYVLSQSDFANGNSYESSHVVQGSRVSWV